jgi:hypothetical protein
MIRRITFSIGVEVLFFVVVSAPAMSVAGLAKLDI